MERFRRTLLPTALLAALLAAITFSVEESNAELDNQVFTSRDDQLRIVVPRGWRATDQASYPGLLLWMMRSQPEGRIVLTAETFTHELYCSWPVACRVNHDDSLAKKYACALRLKLQDQHMRVGPIQAGPKENEVAGLSSVWFEYDDGKHFLRQAVALSTDRAISLVLSTSSSEARLAHVRSYEQALRSLQIQRPIEPKPTVDGTAPPFGGAAGRGTPTVDGTAPPFGGAAGRGTPTVVGTAPPFGGAAGRGTPTVVGTAFGGAAGRGTPTVVSDAAVSDAKIDAGTTFESAPVPKVSPIGACP